MKVLIITLITLILLGSVESLGLRQHEGKVSHQNKTVVHEQSQEALIAIASEAAKNLIQHPYEAAQIPTKYIQGALDGLTGLFEGAWNIKDRTRSLQLTFVNLALEDVVIDGNYFNSGTWFQSWTPIIPAGMVCQGTVANSQGSIMTGVAGGLKLRIKGTNIKIMIGFTNPYIGSYKHAGWLTIWEESPWYGYDQAQNNYPKNSQLQGYRFQVVQTPSTITQMAYVYMLTKI